MRATTALKRSTASSPSRRDHQRAGVVTPPSQLGHHFADLDGGSRERAALELQRHVGNAAVTTLLTAASVQRLARGSAVQRQARRGLVQRVAAARSHGTALDTAAKRRLERSYRAGLDGVRVHHDAESDSLTRSINAEAFTSGNHIFFQRGAYDPGSTTGFHTLAHEVAHSVQQASGPVPTRPMGDGLEVSEPSDSGEVEANQLADHATHGRAVSAEVGLREQSRSQVEQRPGSFQVQRKCGSACGCESCGGDKSGSLGQEEPVQTLRWPASASMVIQRKPLPNVPFGDFELMFNPTSSISFTGPDGKTGSDNKNEAAEVVTYSDVPRGSKGQITLDVAMQWFRKEEPTPPKPAGECDVCGILAKALTIKLPFPLPDIPMPEALIKECRKLVKVDISAVEPLLDRVAKVADDPCSGIPEITGMGEPGAFLFKSTCNAAMTAGALGVPGLAQARVAIDAARLQILSGVLKAKDALSKCQKKTPPKPKEDNSKLILVGNAQANMRAVFTSKSDGSMIFSGLSPTPFVQGDGAKLTIPVEHLHRTLPDGGSILQQPVLVTTTGKQGVQAKQFAAEVRKPADVPYTCEKENGFGPFKVASDVFVNDDLKHQEIRDFYFGLHPLIRKDIEEGRGLIRITGRASKTGSQAFNMKLAEKRAIRVKKILRGLMGSDAKEPRIFFLGELGAQTPGCNGKITGPKCEDANERRSDVVVSGVIEGAGSLDSPCSGHIGEPTPSGADFPVVEAGDETEALAAVPEAVEAPANDFFEPAFA